MQGQACTISSYVQAMEEVEVAVTAMPCCFEQVIRQPCKTQLLMQRGTTMYVGAH